jgi:hypothetical protein
MLTTLEIIGVAVAAIAVIFAALFLRKVVGDVEDSMDEVQESERDTAMRAPKPVHPADARRRRR